MTNLHPRYLTSHVYKYKPFANTVEVFLDYNCPFSGKMFIKIQDEIIPLLEKEGLGDKYNIVFVNVVQPWHGVQSSILHDVSFAVGKVVPESFWNVSRILFDNIKTFYDSETFNKTRCQIGDEVIELCEKDEKIGSSEIGKIRELIRPAQATADGGANNAGNGIAKDNKYFARYARTLGVHITPSVLVNGIYIPSIESSTDARKIIEMLENQCN